MSRTGVDFLTTIAVVDIGALVIGVLLLDLCRRELGLRPAPWYRRVGLAATVVFLVVVTLRFSLL